MVIVLVKLVTILFVAGQILLRNIINFKSNRVCNLFSFLHFPFNFAHLLSTRHNLLLKLESRMSQTLLVLSVHIILRLFKVLQMFADQRQLIPDLR
jgi:hypothetical protein